MLLDQTFINLLVGVLGFAGAVAGSTKLCLGHSWSDRSSRIFLKHNEK